MLHIFPASQFESEQQREPLEAVAHGIVMERDGRGRPVFRRVCHQHGWVSTAVGVDVSPRRCPECCAVLDTLPGKARYARRFGLTRLS